MRSRIFTFLFIFLSIITFSNSFGQNTTTAITPDARLYQCFDSAYVQRTLAINPEGILYYNYFLDYSYYIATNDPSKPTTTALDIYKVKTTDIAGTGKTSLFNEDLSKFDAKTFNVLKYDFATDFNKYTTYKLGNTGKLLVFYPKAVFIEMYNEYKKSFGY
jgi:hypothetical protein